MIDLRWRTRVPWKITNWLCRMTDLFFSLPCSLFSHTPDVSWALLSTTVSPLPMAGLCYLEDACNILFIQISPFGHTVKTLRFSLAETCPNSVTYFEDSKSRINGIYFNSTGKIPVLVGFEPLPVEVKVSKMHSLPSELAGPSRLTSLLQLIFCVVFNTTLSVSEASRAI